MVRNNDSNKWNLRDFLETIQKKSHVSESELMINHPPRNLHPTATSYTGATNNPSKSNAVSQYLCAFCKGSYSSIDCEVITDRQAHKGFVAQKNLCFNCLD